MWWNIQTKCFIFLLAICHLFAAKSIEAGKEFVDTCHTYQLQSEGEREREVRKRTHQHWNKCFIRDEKEADAFVGRTFLADRTRSDHGIITSRSSEQHTKRHRWAQRVFPSLSSSRHGRNRTSIDSSVRSMNTENSRPMLYIPRDQAHGTSDRFSSHFC